ncbi:MAG: hypothetical protein V7731_19270 [Amphritea sp.]
MARFSQCYSRYLFGYRRKIALTLCIETGVQNAGTALMVTGVILHNPEMSMSALLYGILMQLPALLLILYRNLNHRAISPLSPSKRHVLS